MSTRKGGDIIDNAASGAEDQTHLQAMQQHIVSSLLDRLHDRPGAETGRAHHSAHPLLLATTADREEKGRAAAL
jgi:hypothetical protein